MRRLFSTILIVFSIQAIIFANENLKQIKPTKYFLEITQWHSLSGEKITHVILVTENSNFEISAKVDNVIWKISGDLGKFTNKTVPVRLITEYFANEKNKEKGFSSLELTLEKECGGFSIHGTGVILLLKNLPK